MKFTESGDGCQRANVRIVVRLTKNEVEELARNANRDGEKLHDYLAILAEKAIHDSLIDAGGEYEQRYGRGGD